MSNEFQVTTAARKLITLKKKIKVIPGGTSAGKTFNILPILFSKAATIPNLSISVVSETMPHLRKGAIRDFISILKMTGRFEEKYWHKTNSVYALPNNSFIEFFSLESADRARGPRRKILYMNEANLNSFEMFYDLLIRTEQEVWLDFNPTNEFWAHTELKDHPDADWLTLTYTDNEALSQSIVREIELNKSKAFYKPELSDLFKANNIKSEYWANWWRVYGMGELGVLEGVVFTDWEQVDEIPKEAVYIGTGMDFGFSNDPTSIIDMYSYNGQKLFDEVAYSTGMGLDATVEALKTKKRIVVADRSNPMLIAEIKKRGVNISAYDATDGKGAINYGVEVLQSEPFMVTKNSTNLIKELRAYCFDKGKDGKMTNNPVGVDHGIDAMRYIGSTGKTRKTTYGKRIRPSLPNLR